MMYDAEFEASMRRERQLKKIMESAPPDPACTRCGHARSEHEAVKSISVKYVLICPTSTFTTETRA